MNILFHSYAFPPRGWGIGSYIASMARALTAAGHNVVIVTGRSTGLPEQEKTAAGTLYRIYEQSEIGSARVRDEVLSLARTHAVDLIEGADHLGDCASVLRAEGRPPVMIKAQTSNPLKVLAESEMLYPWQRLTLKAAHLRAWRQVRAEKYCIEHADILCLSSKRMLQELCRQGLRIPARVGVVPNPVEPLGMFCEHEAPAPTLLMVGRLDIGKGIQYLPGIMAEVTRRFPEAVLEIIGGDSYARGLGSLKAWLTARFGEGLHSVRFLGHVDEAELDAAYQRAWAVLVPSRWDNFPNVILEAMARGKAVVASPHGGMPEMLEGTLCPVADPAAHDFVERVCELLGDSEQRRAAGESALRKAEAAYHPRVVARQYIEFVRQHV